jgi:cell wall-associated NlpC family hydrolase
MNIARPPVEVSRRRQPKALKTLAVSRLCGTLALSADSLTDVQDVRQTKAALDPTPVMRLAAGATLMALAVIASACASTGAVPRPFPTPGGPSPAGLAVPPTSSASALGAGGFDTYALVGTALALRGTPYRNGGGDQSGFDCSGFTQFVFAQHGVSLPREVREQYRLGKPIGSRDLAAGDLVFFTTTEPGASHVAIAIGGDEFVHAPSSSGVVRVEHLGTTYWSERYLGARRVIAASTPP